MAKGKAAAAAWKPKADIFRKITRNRPSYENNFSAPQKPS